MNKTTLTGFTVLMLGISLPGFAAEAPSWNYASLEWAASGDFEFTGFSERMDGYRLEVAKGLGDFLLVRAASNAYLVDIAGTSIDLATQQLGVGAHYAVPAGASYLDVWGALNYERITFFGVVGTGPGVDLGIRAMLAPAFEIGLTGKVSGDIDFGNGVTADYTGYTLNADFAVTKGFMIQGSFGNYNLDDGVDTYKYKNIVGLGVRLTY